MRHDHPNVLVRREFSFLQVAGTTTQGHMMVYQKARLKSVSAKVRTAGTATAYAATIQNGTTSIGAITLSTNTAGVTTNVSMSNSALAQYDMLNVVIGGDVTGVSIFTYEFEVLPDAVLT